MSSELQEEFCIECESEKIEKVTAPEVFKIRGDEITVDVTFWHCMNCYYEWQNLNECNEFDTAYRIYRQRHNMLQPEQIKALRKKYDLTQVELSKLIGCGLVTLTRHEKGALQDTVHDNLLKLLDDPRNLIRLLEQNPEALPREKYNKLTGYGETHKEILTYDQIVMENLEQVRV
jgi:putative zinc finger/helix-turn-helix YgiT family protein